MSGPNDTIRMVGPDGAADVPIAQVEQARAKGYTVETKEQAYDRRAADYKEEHLGGVAGQVQAGILGLGRAVTLGGSDALISAVGGGEYLRDMKELHPTTSTVTEIAGSLLPVGAVGQAAKFGQGLAKTAEGASALTKLGRAAKGYGAEGLIVGGGQGVSEIALSKDELTLEHIASSLGSNMLFGGAAGAGLGVASKGLELGLGRAKSAIDDFKTRREATEAVGEDLAQMDVKQLRAAREAELGEIKLAQKAEVEAAETARAADRQVVADEINTYRRALKSESHQLTTKGVDLPSAGERWGAKEIGKVAMDADRQLDRLLNNPIALAKEPTKAKAALGALQQQENAYVKLLDRSDELRAAYGTGELAAKRAAALDSIPGALERNRALQQRIEGLATPIKPTTLDSSVRLQKIDEARELLAAGRGEKSLSEQMLQGAVFSGVAGAVGGIASDSPIGGVLGMMAPFLGARASKLVGEQVFGRAGKAAGEVAKRGADAVGKFLEVGQKVVAKAPPLATRALNAARFAEGKDDGSAKDLAGAYKARSEEIRSQTAYAPDGSIQMRPEARQAVADRLLPIRAVDPFAADRIETLAARKLTFLASKIPRKPDIGGLPLGGPDRWKPSDMAMRQFARFVAAVEDPMGVVDRLADGIVTSEDAETMRAVYPEMHADITRQIVTGLPTLRKALPYNRRLALSIFSGVPVDPSLDPRIMGVLQAQFATEDGTEGGTQVPTAQANFGSVSKSAPNPTPAQERSA